MNDKPASDIRSTPALQGTAELQSIGMTTLGLVFAIALFGCIAVLARLTQGKLIDEPLKEARARRSLVAEFTDDLQKHRWAVIIGLAVLVAVDKSVHFSGGMLQSRLSMAILITALFVGRLLLRQRTRDAHADPNPKDNQSARR